MLKKKLFLSLGALFILLVSGQVASADSWGHRDRDYRYKRWDRHHHHGHYRPSYGSSVVFIPGRVFSVVIGGSRYYHCDGVYYKKHRHGYIVVPRPHTQYREQARSHRGGSDDFEGSFSIKVPTSKGGYVAVKIKKSGSGYVGDRGEYYDDRPELAQLKEIYSDDIED